VFLTQSLKNDWAKDWWEYKLKEEQLKRERETILREEEKKGKTAKRKRKDQYFKAAEAFDDLLEDEQKKFIDIVKSENKITRGLSEKLLRELAIEQFLNHQN
jgi:hypothetical protein